MLRDIFKKKDILLLPLYLHHNQKSIFMRLLFFSFLFFFFTLSATAQVAVKESPHDTYFFSPERVEIAGNHFQVIPVKRVKNGLFAVTYITDPITYRIPKRGKGFKMTANRTGQTLRVTPEGFEEIRGY